MAPLFPSHHPLGNGQFPGDWLGRISSFSPEINAHEMLMGSQGKKERFMRTHFFYRNKSRRWTHQLWSAACCLGAGLWQQWPGPGDWSPASWPSRSWRRTRTRQRVDPPAGTDPPAAVAGVRQRTVIGMWAVAVPAALCQRPVCPGTPDPCCHSAGCFPTVAWRDSCWESAAAAAAGCCRRLRWRRWSR